jgi:putative transposase
VIDTSLSFGQMIRTLDRIIEQRDSTPTIRTDTGPAFTSKDVEFLCKDLGIEKLLHPTCYTQAKRLHQETQ